MAKRATSMLLSALAFAACYSTAQAYSPGDKAVCETALAIFSEGTPRQRQALQAYVSRTLAAVNRINVRHGGIDLTAQLGQRPYTALSDEMLDECRIDISETIYLAVGRVYKKEAGAGVPRV